MADEDDNRKVPAWPFVKAHLLELFQDCKAYTRENFALGLQTLLANQENIKHVTKSLAKSVAMSALMGFLGMFIMEYEFLFTKLILKYVHKGADPVAIVKNIGALFVALATVGYSIAHYRVGVTLKDLGQVAQGFIFLMASHLTYYSGYKAGLLMKQVGIDTMWVAGLAYLATELVGHTYNAYQYLNKPSPVKEKADKEAAEAEKAASEVERLAHENALKERLRNTIEANPPEPGHELGVRAEGDRPFDLAAWNLAQEEQKAKAAADAEAKRVQAQQEAEERRAKLAAALDARIPQPKP